MSCLLFLGCGLLGCSLPSGGLFLFGLLLFVCSASDGIFMLFFEFLLILGLIAFCKFCIKKIRALHNLLLGCTFLSSGGFLLFGFFIEFFIRASWDIVNILGKVFTRFVTRYGLNNG